MPSSLFRCACASWSCSRRAGTRPIGCGRAAALFPIEAQVDGTVLSDLGSPREVSFSSPTLRYAADRGHVKKIARLRSTKGRPGARKKTYQVNTDDLGSLIHRFWPRLRVFVWRKVLDRYGVTAAVVDPGAQRTALLRASPGWEVAHDDQMNAIFFRRGASGGSVE